MSIIKKLSTAKRTMATKGTVATLRLTRDWADRRFRNVIFGTPVTWRKFDLINELARIHGYRSVLEISTSGSGYSYDQFDQSRFNIRRRLSYLTPNDWTDGEPVDYRSPDHDTSECLRQIRAQGLSFDVVFVDGCHEYECTRRDLQDALNLVNDNGIIVLHDCLPQSQAECAPVRGNLEWWLGLSYKAYLDILMARSDLWYCTVDTDLGCGMIRSNQKTRHYKRAIDGDDACIRAWRNVGDNYDLAFHLYERNRDALMNVVTVNRFLSGERKA